jgi:hypothetical protein
VLFGALAFASCSIAHPVPESSTSDPGARPRKATPVASLQLDVPAKAVPLGQSFAFRVIARDGRGAIITGAYDHPIALAAGGLSLSSYSVANASQSAALTGQWAHGVSGTAAATLEASADGHTATAYVAPGTGFALYDVGGDPNADFSGFQIVLGPNGDLYYGALGRRNCPPPCPPLGGAIGRFDPSSDAFTELDLSSEILGLLFTNDGALWAACGTSGKIFRLPPGRFSMDDLQTIDVPAPSTKASFTPRLLAQDAGGNVWFGDGAGGRILRIPAGGPYTTRSIAAFRQPRGPAGTPQAPPYIGGIAYDGLGHVDALDYSNGVIDSVWANDGRNAGQKLLPQQKSVGAAASTDPRFLIAGPAPSMWVSYLGAARRGSFSVGGIDRFDPSSGLIAPVPLASVPAGDLPDSLSLAGANLYYADIGAHAVGVVNVQNRSSRLIPTQPFLNFNARLSPGGIAALPDGSAWFTCANGVKPFLPMCLGHTVYLNGWSIFPGPGFNVGVGAELSQIVGIMEAPSVDSGPFTATASQPKICRVSPVRDHNFVVTGLGKGSCVLRVTDAHHVSETVAVTVL